MANMIEVKQSVIDKLNEVHGIDFNELSLVKESDIQIKNAVFDAFNVPTGSLNYRLLVLQGVNEPYVKLQSLKKGSPDMKQVVLFRSTIQNGVEKLISFYSCYVESTDVKPTQIIGVTPIKADNSNKKSKARTNLVTMSLSDTVKQIEEVKKPAVIENVAKHEPDKLDQVLQAISFLTAEINTVKSDLDAVKASKKGLFKKNDK